MDKLVSRALCVAAVLAVISTALPLGFVAFFAAAIVLALSGVDPPEAVMTAMASLWFIYALGIAMILAPVLTGCGVVASLLVWRKFPPPASGVAKRTLLVFLACALGCLASGWALSTLRYE